MGKLTALGAVGIGIGALALAAVAAAASTQPPSLTLSPNGGAALHSFEQVTATGKHLGDSVPVKVMECNAMDASVGGCFPAGGKSGTTTVTGGFTRKLYVHGTYKSSDGLVNCGTGECDIAVWNTSTGVQIVAADISFG
jgi:hypothetical protein